MAGEKKAAANQTSVTPVKQSVESIYSVQELTEANEKVFGVKRECVVAALKEKGKDKLTLTEAKKIVSDFLKREVN